MTDRQFAQWVLDQDAPDLLDEEDYFADYSKVVFSVVEKSSTIEDPEEFTEFVSQMEDPEYISFREVYSHLVEQSIKIVSRGY